MSFTPTLTSSNDISQDIISPTQMDQDGFITKQSRKRPNSGSSDVSGINKIRVISDNNTYVSGKSNDLSITISKIPANYYSRKTFSRLLCRTTSHPIKDLIMIGNNQAIVKCFNMEVLSDIKKHLPDLIGEPLTFNLSPSRHMGNQNNQLTSRPPTFSLVIKGVEKDISIEEIMECMTHHGYSITKAWRITSKATSLPTTLIRIITNDQNTADKLLSEGFFAFCHKYRTEPSHPLPAQPASCARCSSYEHSTTACKASAPKCARCAGPHPLSRCDIKLNQPRCANCNGDHAALSHICKKRPLQPTSRETTANLKPIDPPFNENAKEEDEIPDNENTKVEDFLRFITLTLLDLLPNQRNTVANTITRLARHFFSINVKVLYSGNRLHVYCDPVQRISPPWLK